MRLRISSRSRRFTRLRTTAEPTARLTTKPTFGTASFGTGPTGSNSAPETTEPPARRPERSVRRNSSELRIRVCPGSTTPPAQPRLPVRLTRGRAARALDQTASWSRPLRRRAASTARPARVRMRSRKPWTFARRRLFGWNVRLLTGTPDSMRCKGRTCHWSRGQILARPRPGSPHRRDKGQPVNGKGDRCAGQTEPSAPPGTARSPGFHHGTPRFPQHSRRRRLRLWKNNVRRPTRWELAAAR
jgi:hypothetical protein